MTKQIIEVTEAERAEYDKPLSESEIRRLLRFCFSALNKKSASEATVRKHRVTAMKLNNMLRDKLISR